MSLEEEIILKLGLQERENFVVKNFEVGRHTGVWRALDALEKKEWVGKCKNKFKSPNKRGAEYVYFLLPQGRHAYRVLLEYSKLRK